MAQKDFDDVSSSNDNTVLSYLWETVIQGEYTRVLELEQKVVTSPSNPRSLIF